VALWRCGAVALWRCGAVALWRCGAVALWRCLHPSHPFTPLNAVVTSELKLGYVLNRSINNKAFNLMMREPGATFHAKAKRMYSAYFTIANFLENFIEG